MAAGRERRQGVADRFLLDVANRRRLSADVTRAVLGVERTSTMETAAGSGFPALAVALDDPRDVLMSSNVLTRPAERALGSPVANALRPIDVLVDGAWYRLRAASRDGDVVTLGFNHRGAVYMEEHTSPISASRDDVTRALFVRRQVEEIARKRGAGHRLAFWAYELRRRPPIARAKEELSSRAEEDRDVSANTDAAKDLKGLKLGGVKVNADQRRNIVAAENVCERRDAGPKASLALFMACIVEPADRVRGPQYVPFGNPPGGHSSSVGILQLLDIHGSAQSRRDVERVCDVFLTRGFTGRGGAIEVARKNPGMTAGEVAQAVQGSAYPKRYDAVRRDAERALEAAGGVATREGGEGGSYVKPYRFRRPRGEGGWTNTAKLASEVNKRRFITLPVRGADLFVYGSDADLLRLPTQTALDLDASYVLARPRYDLNYGKTSREVVLTVQGAAFDADFAVGLPVGLLGDSAAAGKWLVWDVSERDGSQAVDLTLRQPQPAKPEPASDRVQRSDSSDSESDADSSASGKVVARAKAISERDLPYVWGGGHANVGRPDRGTGRDPGIGFDCSGYVAACLYAGGMWPTRWTAGVPASGVLAAEWGEAGEGERLTMWANGEHVFLEVKIRGEKVRWIDTSRQAGGSSGPHVRYGSRSTAGFTARRWPGA